MAKLKLDRRSLVVGGRSMTVAWVCLISGMPFGLLPVRAAMGDFTYQGRLTDQESPANGFYEVRFQLFDAATAGLAREQTVTNLLLITNGFFTAVLNFGDRPFDGSTRWLELGIRTNGAMQQFSVLAPRQTVTATPQAMYAERVGATGITGVVSDELLGTNIARLNADAVFTGAVQFTNRTNLFLGTFSGDGGGLYNISAAGLVGGINTTNPQINGVVKYGTDIISVAEQVEANFEYPTGPPAGFVWRSLVPANDIARQTNWCWIRRSAITVNSPWVQPVLPTGWPTVTSTEFIFGMDGSSFVVLLRGSGSTLGIEVDGVDDLSRYYTPADVKTHYYTVNFAASARRQIVLRLSGNYQFGGLYVPATNGLWPGVLPKQHRMIVVGDSFSEDISSSSWTSCLMSLFRNIDVWSSSVGSTGYLNPGTAGRVNFQDRIVADVVTNLPDYVLFAGGINDNTLTTNGATANALRDACLNCYQTLQSNLPNCKIIVLGPFWPRTPDVPSIHLVNNAISNACQLAGIGSNYIDTISNPWITGVWNQPGSGNAVRYTLSDGTHPTSAGAWNIAYHVAAELTPRFPELDAREKTR